MGCDMGPSYDDIIEAEKRERENEKKYTSRDITQTVVHAKIAEAYRTLAHAQRALRSVKATARAVGKTPFVLGRTDEAIGNVQSAKRRLKKLERVRDEARR